VCVCGGGVRGASNGEKAAPGGRGGGGDLLVYSIDLAQERFLMMLLSRQDSMAQHDDSMRCVLGLYGV